MSLVWQQYVTTIEILSAVVFSRFCNGACSLPMPRSHRWIAYYWVSGGFITCLIYFLGSTSMANNKKETNEHYLPLMIIGYIQWNTESRKDQKHHYKT